MRGFGAAFGARPRLVSFALLALILATAWFAYRPALSGTFLLDDFENLGGLEVVRDPDSAIDFVLSGIGGPTGRPIAMATFVPQASDWKVSAAPFLRVNLLIHLLNGILLYLVLRQLTAIALREPGDAEFAALAGTAIWLLMPLLASSTLLVVQRMTTLSGSFVLAALWIYLLSRRSVESRPGPAYAGMSIALVLGTVLATLTKENGALLPVFVLVLESTLLRAPTQGPAVHWRAWSAVFLWIPAFAVVAYLASQVSYSDDLILRRDFSAGERLLTEARILWEYLLNAFVPRPVQLGPFHDTYAIARSLRDPGTLLAVVTWLTLLCGAVLRRQAYPVAAFAVLWFFAGHLLESTVIPLELYFEHRNYLPVVGPVYALAIALGRMRGDYRKYARASLALLALLNAGVLFSVATLWGKPLDAATYWYVQRPDSVRAATTLASRQLDEIGPTAAMISLDQFASIFPSHAYIRIPALTLACATAPNLDHSPSLDKLGSELPGVAFSFTTVSMLDQLLTVAAEGQCESVTISDVRRLASSVLENPAYGGAVRYRQLHHKLMARIARIDGDSDATLNQIERALDYSPDDELNMMMVTTLVENGRFDDARVFLETANDELPLQPLRRIGARRRLQQLADYVREAERSAQGDIGPARGDLTEND
jgi:hypothetical protein